MLREYRPSVRIPLRAKFIVASRGYFISESLITSPTPLEGSTVLLYGKVLNPILKDDAAAIAATAQGVTSVINHIKLLSDAPSDNQIRFAVFGAIYSDPMLGRYAFAGSGGAIHIVVEGGRVTLEGEFALASDARRIVKQVGTVPRVLSILSHLVTGN
jgi:osmotically-inducible protein OsmY